MNLMLDQGTTPGRYATQSEVPMHRLFIGASLTAKATCDDEGKPVQIEDVPAWPSTNPNVANVAPSADGLTAKINAVGPGDAQITVTATTADGVLTSRAVDVHVDVPTPTEVATFAPSIGKKIRFLSEFIGQEQLKEVLVSKLRGAKIQQRSLPHMLFCGPPDWGKVTLARCLTNELGTEIQYLNAPAIKRPGEMLPFLTAAVGGSILLIEDIDALTPALCEFLLPALEDFRVDIELGEEADARTISMALKRFTAIGTTTKPSRVDKRLARWFAVCDFKAYSVDEVSRWVQSLATNAGIQLPSDSLHLVTNSCQGSLSQASALVKKLRVY